MVNQVVNEMVDEGWQSPVLRQLAWLRSLSWPAALAGIAILGLLLAFHQVVSGSVRQGEQRRAAQALKGEATWRCNAIASLRERDGCLVQLSALPHDEAGLRARSVVRGTE